MRNRSPVISAMIEPLHLATLAIAVVAGACSSWVLFPVGLLLWGVMVLITLRDPSMVLNQKLEDRQALAMRFQSRYDRLEKSQVRIFNTVKTGKRNLSGILQPIVDEVDALVEDAYQLCVNMSILENHRLVSQMNSDLKNAISDVETKLAAATDPLVRKEYEDNLRSMKERFASLQEVNTQLERTEAMLSGLGSELDRVLTEVIRIQTVGGPQAREMTNELQGAIRQEHESLRKFTLELARKRPI